jgi:hypothetical protein
VLLVRGATVVAVLLYEVVAVDVVLLAGGSNKYEPGGSFCGPRAGISLQINFNTLPLF